MIGHFGRIAALWAAQKTAWKTVWVPAQPEISN
jgi:hypothetical protein